MGRLFWKFFLSILLAQLAATVGVSSVFWLREQARERAAAQSIDTSPPAEFMLQAAAATLTHGGSEALRELVAGTSHRSVLVLDTAGRDLLGRSVAPELRAEAERELASDSGRHVRKLAAPDGQVYLIFVPRDGQRRPGLGVPGSPDGRPHGPPLDRHFRPLAPIIAATLASLLFAALLAWYFARPIRALRDAFDAAAAGDLTPRFAGGAGARNDELSDLGRDFDRMSARLRALMDGQRRLLHDVSHELRSPLARLQAAIGLAHQQPDKVGASLQQIERESVRMDKLVGELLTLARLEAAGPPRMDELIGIGDMVDEIAADARFEAAHSGTRVDVAGSADVNVSGAPDLLWRALENVVRNAIKHGGGGAVEIRLRTDAVTVHIDVLDRGPGIAEADLGSVFQPFFRSSASRVNVDGHGLGLAIAKRVVEAHGGAIAAANRDGGGLCVSIALPLAG
jgi:two-component system OmpR family sensor kinase